ncbi:MAG TPA: glycosyltransferase family 2 protein [Thermoanaerobaculia bacterium]|jgi:glycosyltransferase involved in cell wall biosynthesis|nr:glycosyltransferase family 2 protein [Thermoanaerobaculia bacterium]
MASSMLDRITPLILTRDEEANIGRTLAQLTWAKEVIVVDSLSTDRTVEIAQQFANVRVVSRAFDSHDRQWTFGVEQVATPWVLTLDADYFVPGSFIRELAALDPPPDVSGYDAAFVYAVDGRPLCAALYPPRAVLLRRGAFEIWQDGHTQRVRVHGRVERLHAKLIHDDRKDLRRFIGRQRKYMRQEAAKLRATPWRALPMQGRIRKLRVIAPFATLLYTMIVKRAAFDGRAGWRYAFERFLAEAILSIELFRSGR